MHSGPLCQILEPPVAQPVQKFAPIPRNPPKCKKTFLLWLVATNQMEELQVFVSSFQMLFMGFFF